MIQCLHCSESPQSLVVNLQVPRSNAERSARIVAESNDAQSIVAALSANQLVEEVSAELSAQLDEV